MKGNMPVIPAAALGALVGAMMPRGGKSGYYRGTRSRRMARGRMQRRVALRTRGRSRRLTKRQWKARARKHVGLPKNYSSSKTSETVIPTQFSVNQHFVNAQQLLAIGPGQAINARERDQIYLGGISLKFWVQNINANSPNIVNWAVVSARANIAGTAIDSTTPDLFRSYSDERAWNANDAGFTGLSWANAAINTDRYVVHARGKMTLTPNISTATTNPPAQFNYGANQKHRSVWVPIRRSITYDDGAGNVEDPIHFVIWCSYPGDNAKFNTGQGIVYRLRAVCYFREPKTG